MSPHLLFRAGNMIQYKTYQCASKAVNVEEGIYELMPSVESVDRDGDVLVAAGADLAQFRRNPVVLYAHNYTDLPVAKALQIDIVPGVGLRAQIQFAPPGANPKADSVRALWAAGFLNAASVGFIPRAADAPKDGEHGRRFTDWELLEFSIVPVPANADALRLAAKHLQPETKRGRVLSGVNEKRIRDAVELLTSVLSQLDSQPEPAPEEESAGPQEKASEVQELEVRAAIPSHETPMADRDTEWDGPGVVADLPNDREALRLVHAWVDSKGDPDAKQSYKFPHHLANGEVVLRGVNNAMARLGQADIPAGDRAGVEAHLRRHQGQFAEEEEEAAYSATVGEKAEEAEVEVNEQLAAKLAELVHIIREYTNGR